MGLGLSYVADATDIKYRYMKNALIEAGCECGVEVPVVSELPFILWHGVLRELHPRDICLVKCMCSRCKKRTERDFFTDDIKRYDGYLSRDAWNDIRAQGPTDNGCSHEEIYMSNYLSNMKLRLVHCLTCGRRWTVE